MRIVAGRHRGRRLVAPAGKDIRPTSDRVREALFNLLAHGLAWHGLAGARVADLFCGTGAVALEALSRGALDAVLVDDAPGALDAASGNITSLGEQHRTILIRCSAHGLLPAIPHPVDFAYLDPPYESGLAPVTLANLESNGWLVPGALAVVELPKRTRLQAPGSFEPVDDRVYGQTRLMFLRFRG